MTSPVGPEIMFGGYTLFAERGVIIGGASRDILRGLSIPVAH